MVIEEVSIAAIKNAIGRSHFLDPSGIKDGDRSPSWDGEIVVYKSSEHSKNNIDGRVPVQVKGVECEDLSKEAIKFAVNIADLTNYLHEGGALYFVVYANAESQRIYYRRLAPFDINSILESVEPEQKTKSIEFYPFPTDSSEIDSEVISFLHDCNKQTLVRDGKNKTIDEICEVIDPSQLEYKISYIGIGYQNRDPIEFFLEHDTYLYAENKELNISFPIDRLPKSDAVEREISTVTQVGDNVYFNSAIIRYTKSTEEVLLGKCVRFVIKDETNKPSLSFKAVGDLDSRIVGEEFLYDYLTSKNLIVNGKAMDFPFEDEEIAKNFNLSELANEIERLKVYRDTLRYYGVADSLELDGMTSQDYRHLNILVEAFKSGSVRLNEKNLNRMIKMRIRNLVLILDFREIKDHVYEIESFFKSTIPCQIALDDSTFNTSQFCMIGVEDFCNASNVSYDRIVKDIDLFDDSNHIDQMRLVMLRLLCAYDKTKKDNALFCAKKMARKIRKKGQAEDIDLINLIQCNARMRAVNKNEKASLRKLLDKEVREEVKIAVNLLLGRIDEARVIYNGLPEDERKGFDEYPINAFWQQQ